MMDGIARSSNPGRYGRARFLLRNEESLFFWDFGFALGVCHPSAHEKLLEIRPHLGRSKRGDKHVQGFHSTTCQLRFPQISTKSFWNLRVFIGLSNRNQGFHAWEPHSL